MRNFEQDFIKSLINNYGIKDIEEAFARENNDFWRLKIKKENNFYYADIVSPASSKIAILSYWLDDYKAVKRKGMAILNSALYCGVDFAEFLRSYLMKNILDYKVAYESKTSKELTF